MLSRDPSRYTTYSPKPKGSLFLVLLLSRISFMASLAMSIKPCVALLAVTPRWRLESLDCGLELVGWSFVLQSGHTKAFGSL